MVARYFTEGRSQTLFGVKFPKLLDSAVNRPKGYFSGTELYDTLEKKAAALTHSLILNHAFHDANKRTGILSGCVFMQLNGCHVVAERTSLRDLALAVESKQMSLADLGDWFGDTTNILPLTEEEWRDVYDDESGIFLR